MLPPLDKVASDATLPTRVDVVVIGGGIIGVSAAYLLAKKGHSVALVEKGRIAGEQSSRNWGWCRQQNRDRRELPLMKHSMDLWERAGREIGADMGFRRTGLIYVDQKPSGTRHLGGMGRRWRGSSRSTAVFSVPAEARAMTPGNEQDWIGGMHSPSDGRAEPAMAAPAWPRPREAMGVTMHQDCAVRGIETPAAVSPASSPSAGASGPSAVLCAAGAWASMFCRRHGIHLPQAGMRSTIFCTTPGAGSDPGRTGDPRLHHQPTA